MTFGELYTRMIDLLNQDSPSDEDIDAWMQAAMADRITPVMEKAFAEIKPCTFDELLSSAGVKLP